MTHFSVDFIDASCLMYLEGEPLRRLVVFTVAFISLVYALQSGLELTETFATSNDDDHYSLGSESMANFTVHQEDDYNFSIALTLGGNTELIAWGVHDAGNRIDLLVISSEEQMMSGHFTLNGTSCSCLYWAELIENGTSTVINSFEVEFLGEEPHLPIVVITDEPGDYVRNTMALQGEVFTSDSNQTTDLRLALCSEDTYQNGQCQYMLETIFDPVQSTVQIPVEIEWDDNRFTISVSVEDNGEILVDDRYFPIVSVRDETLMSSYAVANLIIVDTTKPHAEIIGPTDISEQTETVILDGSASIDIMSEIHFSWIITEPSGNLRGPSENESEGTFLHIAPISSGNWQFLLHVTDSAGNRNTTYHNMSVENIWPSASIGTGGMELLNDTLHRLPLEQNWTFSAENSTDSANDIGALNYHWYIDDQEVCNSIICMISNEELTGIHYLRLVVTDDDGANDTITVQIVVFGSDSDPSSNSDDAGSFENLINKFGMTSFLLGLLILVLSVTLTVSLLNRKEKNVVHDIPKWGDETNN